MMKLKTRKSKIRIEFPEWLKNTGELGNIPEGTAYVSQYRLFEEAEVGDWEVGDWHCFGNFEDAKSRRIENSLGVLFNSSIVNGNHYKCYHLKTFVEIFEREIGRKDPIYKIKFPPESCMYIELLENCELTRFIAWDESNNYWYGYPTYDNAIHRDKSSRALFYERDRWYSAQRNIFSKRHFLELLKEFLRESVEVIDEYDDDKHTIVFANESEANISRQDRYFRQSKDGCWYGYKTIEDASAENKDAGHVCLTTYINEKSYAKVFSLKAFWGAIQSKFNVGEIFKDNNNLLPTDFAEAELRTLAHMSSSSEDVSRKIYEAMHQLPEQRKRTKEEKRIELAYLYGGWGSKRKVSFKYREAFQGPTQVFKFSEDNVHGATPDFVFGGDECMVSFGCEMEEPVKECFPSERASTNGMVDVSLMQHLASILQHS